MKVFRLIGMALVAMTLCFNLSSCNDDDDDDNFIKVDYSKDLVGTWTGLNANIAVALEISADGSLLSTGVENGEYWENAKGTVEVENNKIEIEFEDEDYFEGRFEIIPGEAFSVIDDETGERFTFRYCKQDLSKEIVGQWVSTQTYTDTDVMIQHFNEDGTAEFTGSNPAINGEVLEKKSTYKVIGDLLLQFLPGEGLNGTDLCVPLQIKYAADGTAYGDIMTFSGYSFDMNGEFVNIVFSWLRVKQYLELPTAKYNYKSTYISNAKGEGVINIDGYNFDFSKMDGVTVNKLFKTLLYTLEFPTTDSLTYSYTLNGTTYTNTVPVTVEGNKMTVHMDKTAGLYRDMDLYVFQDKDNTQMHIYMSKSAFINFFGNTALSFAAKNGQIDPTNADAVNGLFNLIASHVTSINASFVLTK